MGKNRVELAPPARMDLACEDFLSPEDELFQSLGVKQEIQDRAGDVGEQASGRGSALAGSG